MNRRKLFESIVGVFVGAKVAPSVLASTPKAPIPTNVNWSSARDLWFEKEAMLLEKRMALTSKRKSPFTAMLEKGNLPEGMGLNYTKASYKKVESPAIHN